jgi:hypothetical protein
MRVEIERTKVGQMTDMYKLTLLPVKARFVCFTKRDWEKEFPNILLQRGEKKEVNLRFEDLTSDDIPV